MQIANAEDVIDASFFLTAGDKVPVVIERGGEVLSIEVRPVEHPVSNSSFYPATGLSELRGLAPSSLPENLRLE